MQIVLIFTRISSTLPSPTSTAPSNAPQVTTSFSSSSSSSVSTTSATTTSALPSGVYAAPSFSGDFAGTFARTITYTAASPGSTNGIAIIDCPASNNTQFTTSTGDVFTKRCYKDILGATDLNHVVMPSLDACINACSLWNTQGYTESKRCVSVSYSANITSALGRDGPGDNCHLKDSGKGVTNSHWFVIPILFNISWLQNLTYHQGCLGSYTERLNRN